MIKQQSNLNENGLYTPAAVYAQDDFAKVHIFPDFAIDTNEVFEE